jgi:hypothetical protein
MSVILQCKDTGNIKPHREGIWPAVCLDVIELGMMWSEFQGQRKLVQKLKVVFETEDVGEDGKRCIATKNFTASLHPKAKLAEFLGKWRGRPVVPGDSIDLSKLIGACCTLVISHQKNFAGRTYASIDAISKPTKSVAASGAYDPVAMRQRIEEWKAKDAAAQRTEVGGQTIPAQPSPGLRPPSPAPASEGQSKSAAPTAAQTGVSRTGQDGFDPEVGF